MQPLISLILPYWDRQGAADRAFESLARCYAGLDIEIIVVDDGNAVPHQVPHGLPFQRPVQVVRMPVKAEPLSSCVPMNRGVEASSGKYIALSSIEMLHTAPVLLQMADAIDSPDTYVLAACRSGSVWHCHSANKRSDEGDVGSWLPPGSDYHFMSMLSRELWDKTGGFDEEYRQGAGYEDADFVRRLHRAGAKFLIRDDLVIEHPRDGARAAWKTEMFSRNRALFMSKWVRLR